MTKRKIYTSSRKTKSKNYNTNTIPKIEENETETEKEEILEDKNIEHNKEENIDIDIDLDDVTFVSKKSRTIKNKELYVLVDKNKKDEIKLDDNDDVEYSTNLEETDSLDKTFLEAIKHKKSSKNEIKETKTINKKNILILFLILIIIILSILTILFYNKKQKVKIEKKTIIKEKLVKDTNYLFLGDSIFDFYDLDKFYDNYNVVNSGKSGNTCHDILDNMKERVYQYNPSDIFLLIGTNDINNGDTPDVIIENIQEIINNIRTNRKNSKIYIQSVYPVNKNINSKMVAKRDNETIKELNDKIKKYCDKEKIEYIYIYDKLVDKDGNFNEEYTNDGLHPNDKGYEVITEVMKEYMKKVNNE